jgi:hypothetical protein
MNGKSLVKVLSAASSILESNAVRPELISDRRFSLAEVSRALETSGFNTSKYTPEYLAESTIFSRQGDGTYTIDGELLNEWNGNKAFALTSLLASLGISGLSQANLNRYYNDLVDRRNEYREFLNSDEVAQATSNQHIANVDEIMKGIGYNPLVVDGKEVDPRSIYGGGENYDPLAKRNDNIESDDTDIYSFRTTYFPNQGSMDGRVSGYRTYNYQGDNPSAALERAKGKSGEAQVELDKVKSALASQAARNNEITKSNRALEKSAQEFGNSLLIPAVTGAITLPVLASNDKEKEDKWAFLLKK